MVDERNDCALDALAAEALRTFARDLQLKAFIEKNRLIYDVALRAAMRYIGGETLDACVGTVRAVNRLGVRATADYMGENTRDEELARRATEEFLRLCVAIERHGLDCSISLDLTHVGLLVDPALALENAERIAGAARAAGVEVVINMEGSDRTEAILRAHETLCRSFDNVGITLQAYLFRTPDDLRAALERPGRIRLVKGAYAEPTSVALARNGDALDAAYRNQMTTLLSSGHRCAIATHDEQLLALVPDLAERSPTPSALEIEMLHGVTPERLLRMKELGFAVREYVPYGHEWHLYVCHRLAEHPPNVYRALADCAGVV